VALGDRVLRLAKAPHLPRRTVRLRLTLLYSAVFLISGAVLLATTYFLVQEATGNAYIEQTKNGVTILGYQIGSPPRIHPLPTRSLLAQHPPGFSAGTYLHAAVGQTAGAASSTSLTEGPVAAHGKLTGKQIAAAQRQVAQQQAQFEAFAHAYQSSELHQLLIESGIGLGLMAVLSVALGWLMAGRVLRPLRTITATTRNISASTLHERLDLDGPDDELKELGETIDGLLERLDASFRSQRQFVANASHELRTPLARQRTLAQVALSDPDATADSLRAAHERILASGEQQEQMIDALLTLSRAQSSALSLQPVDLGAKVRELVGAREAEAVAGKVRFGTTLRPAEVEGDPRLLERLVANLVDNAVRHNVEGGRVSVRTGSRSTGAWLIVTNDGPVIDPDEVERLFAPFERLGTQRTVAREGFGLGLCIVRAIATAHGASVSTVVRPEGGLSIEVRFPARSSLEEAERGPADATGPAFQRDLIPEGRSDERADLVHVS
jgi:signal transduction histidine kinase